MFRDLDAAVTASNPLVACAVGVVEQQAPTTAVGAVCFEAFGAWPASLHEPLLVLGAADGGVRATTGEDLGVALLVGQTGDPFADGARFASSVSPGEAMPRWIMLGESAFHRAAFLARPAGTFVAGLASAAAPLSYLDVFPGLPSSTDRFPGVACGNAPVVADAAANGQRIVLAASSGRSFGSCLDDDGIPGPPTALQVSALGTGGFSLLHEETFATAVDAVRAVAAPDGSTWIVSSTSGTVHAMRLDANGSVQVASTVVARGSVGPVDAAMRGHELLVAHIDASEPDLGADVVVDVLSPAGERAAFGGFDSSEAPWTGDLAIVVSADASMVLVTHATGPGMVAARRLDCVER
jgi:hypothetical protein